MAKTCSTCNGNGQVDTPGDVTERWTCGTCDGQGTVPD